MESELKACPFCGDRHPGIMVNASTGIYVHYALCKCGARAKEYVGGFEATLAEAITAWNTRAADPAERAQGFIEGRDAAAAVAANCFGPSHEDEASTCEVVAAAILALSPGKAKP